MGNRNPLFPSTPPPLHPSTPSSAGRRILLLITDLELGGTPTVVRELAVRLNGPPRVFVEVACLGRLGPVAQQIAAVGLPVRALEGRGVGDLPKVMWRLIRLVRRHHFDTVLSFLLHANATAAAASLFCPCVHFLQSIQTTQPLPRWHWRVQRIAQRFAEAVVVPSPSAARVAQAWSRVPLRKLVVISNAIDPADFAPPRSPVGEAPTIRVGFLGRLDPIKRVPDLVEAMTSLDQRFLLHIFGEGEDRLRVEAEVARLSLRDRVTLHGAVARPQEALGSVDVLALPSEAEGFGLVLIEAMASGVPIVATDAPGIRDVVRHGQTGLLVPVGRPQALAAAIAAIASDPALRSRLIEAARCDVKSRFGWPVVLEQYRRLLGIERIENG